MKKHAALWGLGLAALAVLAAVCLWPDTTAEPPLSETTAQNAVCLADTARMLQTLTYTRCDHTVTRRVNIPVELYGAEMEAVETLYPEWRVTAFSQAEVEMEQHLDLYCPDHLVVLPNAGNMLCVFRNLYGDALKLERELSIPLNALPAAVQEELVRGIGFDTAQELEMWLESVES